MTLSLLMTVNAVSPVGPGGESWDPLSHRTGSSHLLSDGTAWGGRWDSSISPGDQVRSWEGPWGRWQHYKESGPWDLSDRVSRAPQCQLYLSLGQEALFGAHKAVAKAEGQASPWAWKGHSSDGDVLLNRPRT